MGGWARGAAIAALAVGLSAAQLECSGGGVGPSSGGPPAVDGGGTGPGGGGSDGGTGSDAGSGSDGGPPAGGGGDAGTPPDGGLPFGGPPTPVLGAPSSSDARTIPSTETLLSTSMDEGGYLWAVSKNTLYLLRPGATSFEAYPNGRGEVGTATCSTGPCQNTGLLSVAGGAPGEAWVGYAGVFQNGTEVDDPSVPLSTRESGGAERFFATASGIQRDRSIGEACPTTTSSSGSPLPMNALPDGHIVFCTQPGVLAAEPSGRWKVRDVWTIAYNHGGGILQNQRQVGIPGDVFFGGNHGMAMWSHTREQTTRFAMQEHQHAGYNYWDASTGVTSLLTGDHHGVAIDPATGNVWMGADYGVIRLHYMDGLAGGDFYEQNVSKAYHDTTGAISYTPDPISFQTWGCTDGVSGCRSLSQDGPSYGSSYHPSTGGRDFVQAMTFDAYGQLWAGSYLNGLARIPIAPGSDGSGQNTARAQTGFQFWNNNRGGQKPGWGSDTYDFVFALQGDPDGSLWVGTRDFGAYRFVAQTGQWVSYAGVVRGNTVTQISLDPRPICPAANPPANCIPRRRVYFATDQGVTVYSGP